MPKRKTNKSIAKRIKVTARGKLMRRRPCAGHLKSVKSPRQVRRFRKTAALPKAFVKNTKILLGRSV
jgi:large subunit ribosomal protein L35